MIGATKIDTREELINALTQAAELEHGLLCQYLFAALSMKRHPSEDVAWPQVELIRGWERHVLRVAREEMAHLGTVSNLLTAIGGAPQFRRPNFPQQARYFPEPLGDDVQHVEFTLEPFSISALDRFIRFEIPEEKLRVTLELSLLTQSSTLLLETSMAKFGRPSRPSTIGNCSSGHVWRRIRTTGRRT